MRRRLMIASALFAATAMPARAQAPQKFIIFFTQWSAELDPAALDVIAAAVAQAKASPAGRVEIVGFASTGGGRQANLYLSLLRAQRVSDLLAEGGIDPARLSRVGEGAVNSVGSDEEARRVEIIVRAP